MNFRFKYRLRIHILHLPTKIDNADIKYNGKKNTTDRRLHLPLLLYRKHCFHLSR